MSVQLLELQQQVLDKDSEVERLTDLLAMSEKALEDWKKRESAVQQQVESSLTESHENMSKILAKNKKLEADTFLLNDRTEKLQQAQVKIRALERELEEKKEMLQQKQKKETEILIQKSEIEDREFNM